MIVPAALPLLLLLFLVLLGVLIVPLAAAGVSLVLAFRRAPPVVSIGGAGTFDGVFLTGIIAGLIA